MELLTPEKTKKEGQRELFEAQARNRDLSREEERLVKSINQLRSMETEERERIHQELDEQETRADARKVAIGKEIAELEGDVVKLEERKKEALKPVEDQLAHAERVLSDAERRSKDLDDREAKLKEGEELLSERLESLDDEKDELTTRSEALDSRERTVLNEESRSKDSLERLKASWVEYHEKVNQTNAAFLKRENEVSARERATDIRAGEQEAKAFEQSEKDREIQSRYAQLEKSSAEIYKLKNEHHGTN